MVTTVHYTAREREAEPGAVDTYSRRPLFPAIRWGAILAGVAVGVSVQFALTLLGVATGFSAGNGGEGDSANMGPLLWAGFCMLIAAFVGGYVAARMSGLKRRADGILHGAVSWAVTTILFASLATTMGGTLLSGVFNNMSQLASTASASAYPQGTSMAALMRGLLANVNQDALRQVQQSIMDGRREQAVAQLIAIGVDPAKAASVVDLAIILAGKPETGSGQGQRASGAASAGSSAKAWVVFLAVAFALAVGIGGGALGAAGSRRVSWSDSGSRPS